MPETAWRAAARSPWLAKVADTPHRGAETGFSSGRAAARDEASRAASCAAVDTARARRRLSTIETAGR